MEFFQHKVVIVGSGFSGQCAAINLINNGISDFVILERRSFTGGTWCQNSYPGAAVDVQSPLYSLSFEPFPWSRMFAEQSELKQYTNNIIEKYNLKDKIKLNKNVQKIKWDNLERKWNVIINGDKNYKAQFIINCTGPLSTPVIPNFKGKELFEGESFHTNNWNQDYDYHGKRVAVIGSGASASQVIPTIAPDVETLHVFQRTPHWVLPRPDRVFSKIERKLLGIKSIYKLVRYAIYWGLETRMVGFKYSQWMMKNVPQRQAMWHLKKQVENEELRKSLTPDYTIGCKRIILSNDLLKTYNRNNTHLYLRENGIKEINKRGILTTQGKQVDLDLIVYATGYDATDGVISYPIKGKNNLNIAQVWEDYPRAYVGTTLPGFPNLFLSCGPNSGIGHTSAIFIIESQMNYIIDAIMKCEKNGFKTFEVKSESEERYTNKLHKEMEKTVWHKGGCNSWYKSKSGKVIAMYPGFSFSYHLMTRKVKNEHHIFS
ncbi:flavin-containing monooxygenase [Veronia pacifica]|uniref:Monooxygenase n=1 Tax=Veronia pacifica TaxID=1080227 RepID=A0A1C3ERP5_9GAMM|nr:NAD(P)/FAD-dependent oxidoreductase [Veronia pacifica]ODA35917.1 monooxygenase [Veronia pacifica]